jgi:hypothetical protein
MMDRMDDEEALRTYADALADAIERAVPGWVERCVVVVAGDRPGVTERAADAGRQAAADVGARVRALLRADVDHQQSNPLAELRAAVRYPTLVLRALGVPPVERDSFARGAFPDDVYNLSPATWSDVDPALVEPGVTWGAAKAHVVLARRRVEGRR